MRGTTVTTIAMVIYCVSLIDKLPPQLIAMTSLFVAGLTVSFEVLESLKLSGNLLAYFFQVASAQTMALGWLAHAGLFCVGYFGQDISHFATGEATVRPICDLSRSPAMLCWCWFGFRLAGPAESLCVRSCVRACVRACPH